MSNWYDDLTKEGEEFLKANKIPFGLLSESEKGLIGPANLSEMEIFSGQRWERCCGDYVERCYPEHTYRLRADWQRPEGKAGHWEYCEVYATKAFVRCHHFDRDGCSWELHKALSMIGFTGIEYAEWPGDMFTKCPVLKVKAPCGEWRAVLLSESRCKDAIPATPSKVCFWVEQKK